MGNSDEKLTAAVKAVAKKGVQLVYDTVGGIELGRNSLKCLQFGGRYCVVGWTSTPMAGGGRGAGADHVSANTLPTNLIMMKGAQVLGCPVATHTPATQNKGGQDVSHLILGQGGTSSSSRLSLIPS